MPTTRSTFLAVVGFLLLGALAANALVSFESVSVLSKSFKNVERPAEVQRTLTLLLSALQDAETGQRGYLLTGDLDYLEPYRMVGERTDSLLARLDTLVSWNPLQVDRMPALREQVDWELEYLSETIEMYDTESQAAALALVQTGRGKEIMNGIRSRIDAMLVEARRVHSAFGERSDDAQQRARLSLAITNCVLALVLLGFGLAVRRHLQNRERHAKVLNRINTSLSTALGEREAALNRVQAMQDQLVQQEKMASMGRLTAGVAHEIKNPLNFVNNFAQISVELADEAAEALDRNDPDETRQLLADLSQNAGKIVAHGQRADEIVRAMLIHARGVKGEREMTALLPLLDTAVLQALGPEGAPDVRISRANDPDLPTVPVVSAAIVRQMTNLIQNALHAVRERAGTGDPSYTPEISITSRLTEDRSGRPAVVVSIEDNGAGIPDELLPRIFEPFFTTKGPGSGTGLGLSLAYDIAVGHGGSLLAERPPAGGARFTVTLPLDLADAELPEPTQVTTADAVA